MTNRQSVWNLGIGIALAIAVLMTAGNAAALDGYQDRRGAFVGIGGAGGMALQGSEVGGALMLDLQLGGGMSSKATFALDVDVWYQFMGGYDNLLINPGPEMSYHFENGLYLRGGIAPALIYYIPDTDETSDGINETQENDFIVGFDATLGVGYEIWFNSNVAVDLGIEGDYIVVGDDDIINVGFVLAMRYY